MANGVVGCKTCRARPQSALDVLSTRAPLVNRFASQLKKGQDAAWWPCLVYAWMTQLDSNYRKILSRNGAVRCFDETHFPAQFTCEYLGPTFDPGNETYAVLLKLLMPSIVNMSWNDETLGDMPSFADVMSQADLKIEVMSLMRAHKYASKLEEFKKAMEEKLKGATPTKRAAKTPEKLKRATPTKRAANETLEASGDSRREQIQSKARPDVQSSGESFHRCLLAAEDALRKRALCSLMMTMRSVELQNLVHEGMTHMNYYLSSLTEDNSKAIAQKMSSGATTLRDMPSFT